MLQILCHCFLRCTILRCIHHRVNYSRPKIAIVSGLCKLNKVFAHEILCLLHQNQNLQSPLPRNQLSKRPNRR